MWGTPARPLKDHLEQLANVARLPNWREEFEKEIADLKARIGELETRL
jgi:hypothetical protein